MGKRNSNNVKSLSDLILRTAKDDLIANAEILGFNQHGEMEGMKTYEMRKYLAKQVLANPKQVLDHLSNEDFALFQQLVDAGPGMSAVYLSNGSLPPCVKSSGSLPPSAMEGQLRPRVRASSISTAKIPLLHRKPCDWCPQHLRMPDGETVEVTTEGILGS